MKTKLVNISSGFFALYILFCRGSALCLPIYAEPAQITPGELLIRLTPEAAADLQRLQADAPIFVLHAKHRVESRHPVFPYLARPTLNPNLKRTYLLRFAPDAALEGIKAAYMESSLVDAVDYNYLRPTLAEAVVPNDPRYAEQWSLPLMKLPQAWAIEKGNPNVVIAIIDSGIDYRHDDLAPKTWTNPGEIPENGLDDDGNGYVDDVHGWDFTDAPNLQAEGDFKEGDNEPIDESGHGTHVAGIAGALPDNGIGIAGVAWHCPLMPVRAGLSLGGNSRMQDDDSAAAIVYAADNGASIINMSWGSAQRSFIIQDAIDYAYARGAVLIAAAGNSQKAMAIFPAAYRKVIAVASTEQHQQRFYQSNFGASVDIGAPGNVILSTQINNNYRLLTGTSMAAPHVAGVAALIRAKRPALTHEEVRHILITTATPVLQEDSTEMAKEIEQEGDRAGGPDPKFVGAGTVNAERALLASSALQARILVPETNSGGADSIAIIGTAGGYKFKTWQLHYGDSTVPHLFTAFTEPASTQKIGEPLAVWDTTTVPEGIYTVRLTATATDGTQTHDQVVLSVDRSPPQVISLNASETLYKDYTITIFTWATDDVTRNTLYYRRKGHLAPFAPIEEADLGTEHFFSLRLGMGTYQFFVQAENTVGLKTTDDNQGQYYTIDVVGSVIAPHGFTGNELGISSLHIASVTADFDRDGVLEIVGTEIGRAGPISFYERTATGKYELVHTLSEMGGRAAVEGTSDPGMLTPWAVDDTDNDGLLELLANDDERTFLIESTTPDGYPEQIIWESPFLSGGSITDLDGDGRKEIIGADNNNDRLLIFEVRGNNLYEEIAQLPNETEGDNVFAQHFAIDDFNADGNRALVAGDSEGELFIYTALANDSPHLQWHTQLDISDVMLLASGDLTGDGRPEFVVGGTLSPPALPSASPLWKFIIFTHTGSGYAQLWEQAVAPYRLHGNSIAIADLDGDTHNELLILTYPNLYMLKWNGTTFVPIWHRSVSETPALFTADLNNNGFHEFYVNTDEGTLQVVESTFATDRNSVETLTPWDVSATPLTAKAVQVTWTVPTPKENTMEASKDERVNAIGNGWAGNAFAVYRAQGEKSSAPADSTFEAIAENLTVNRFLDRTVTADKTYWYAITAKSETGIETERTEAVAATPREPPKLIGATYQPPKWVIVTFDRQMGPAIGDESRYLLREPKRISGVSPVSAIRDRMGTRALLAFDRETLQLLTNDGTNAYELSVSNVADIDENPIRAASHPFTIPLNVAKTAVKDFTAVRVYPNPVHPNVADRGAITFDKVPAGTRIQLFTPVGERLVDMNVTEGDRNRKQWWLTNDGNLGDVASGIYIYIMEFEDLKKVGKIAVIK